MVKATLAVLALAGPTFASVVQRGEGHGEKPHVWEKGSSFRQAQLLGKTYRLPLPPLGAANRDRHSASLVHQD